VLLGAVVAAYLPALLAGARRRGGGHGWQFQLALEVLQQLHKVRAAAQRGLGATELAAAMEVDILQLEPVLQTLVQLDWIGRLNEVDDHERTRYVLLADVQSTALEPLMRQLLLPSSESTMKLWASGRLSSVYLRDVLE
jgi:membrane protein